jgi:Na+-transporting methylmalonyl-CoA/oxaloacetate decarboxylase gamma subunit
MNYLNSVFVVLLVILVAIGAFGYVINEYLDLRELNEAKDAQIFDLQNKLAEQIAQCQIALEEQLTEQIAQCQVALDEQLIEQTAQCQVALDEKDGLLDQAIIDLQTSGQNLDACNATLEQTQQALGACQSVEESHGIPPAQPGPAAQSTQVEPQMPQLGAMISENITVLVVGIGGVVVMAALILRIKVLKAPAVQQPAPVSPALHPNPKQITVKMNTQAYQGYLDYLKAHKK